MIPRRVIMLVRSVMMRYRKDADGQPEIVPEEAEIIRHISHRYLDGCTLGKTKKELDEDGIPTAQGVECWSSAIIHNILTNEKYIGDALLLKTYVTDRITKKVKKNMGGASHVLCREQSSCHHIKRVVRLGAEGDDPPIQQKKSTAKEQKDRAGQILRQVRADGTAGVR